MTHADASSVFLQCEPLRREVFLRIAAEILWETMKLEQNRGNDRWIRVRSGGNVSNLARKRLRKWNHDGPMYRIWFELRRVCREWKMWVDLAAADFYESIPVDKLLALIISPCVVPFERTISVGLSGSSLPLRTQYWPHPLKTSLLKHCWRRIRIGFLIAQPSCGRRLEDLEREEVCSEFGYSIVRSFSLSSPASLLHRYYPIYDYDDRTSSNPNTMPDTKTVYVPTLECFDERTNEPAKTSFVKPIAVSNHEKLRARLNEMKLARANRHAPPKKKSPKPPPGWMISVGENADMNLHFDVSR